MHRLAQISDVHLTRDGFLPGGFDPQRNLVAALAALDTLRRRGWTPDAVLFTGDLANEGGAREYGELARIVADASIAPPSRVMFLPGNHDDRRALRAHLLQTDPGNEPVNHVMPCQGLRIIGLDSSVPGEEFGLLSDDTLEFLDHELTTPSLDGTIVVLHHPPISSPITSMATIALRNPAELVRIIRGTDVRAILCGHNHHVTAGSIEGVPVWSAPSTAFHADVTSLNDFRAQAGCALSLVEVDDGGVRVSAASIIG